MNFCIEVDIDAAGCVRNRMSSGRQHCHSDQPYMEEVEGELSISMDGVIDWPSSSHLQSKAVY